MVGLGSRVTSSTGLEGRVGNLDWTRLKGVEFREGLFRSWQLRRCESFLTMVL